MKKHRYKISGIGILIYLLLIARLYSYAQSIQEPIRWNRALNQEANWYSSPEAIRIADNMLIFQHLTGGWPKNIDMSKVLTKDEIDSIKRGKDKSETELSRATIDNGATSMQLRFLARVYKQTGHDRFKESFIRGLNYYLESQYDNGGWPQFYPLRKGYYQHITYNDNAMVNTMDLLKRIYTNGDEFESLQLSPILRKRAEEAFNKGIQCILKTQIIVNGKPTVWCAQHDEITLAPAKARAYELESFSGSESAAIVLLLMEIEKPSERIIASVKGAVEWFVNHRIEGIKVINTVNADGKRDKMVVEDKSAPPLWARFYDLETGKPYFSSRDGVKRNSLAEISYERRNGYGWYTTAPTKVLDEFSKWGKQNN